MDSFLIAYITQRMGELGFKKWSMEPLLVTFYNAQGEFIIEAQNEYYFLASNNIAQGIEIFSDDNYFVPLDSYIAPVFAYIQEFTGQIRFTAPAYNQVALEFIRVIPQVTQ